MPGLTDECRVEIVEPPLVLERMVTVGDVSPDLKIP
jgi:hypothetical protein